MKKIILPLLSVTVLCLACSNSDENEDSSVSKNTSEEKESRLQKQRPVAVELGKIFTDNGTKMLSGGKDSIQHFNITNSILKDSNFQKEL